MLKFGFMGFGQAGSNVCDLAKSFNYKALAVNTAEIDLQALVYLEKSEKIHLHGYEGAGKDREVGFEAFQMHKEMIIERMKERFSDCHVVFPVFALGGGTGSGMVSCATKALVDAFPSAVISPIVFMPHTQESLRAKMNALEAFSDLTSIEEIGATFVIDNNRILERNEGVPLKEKYKRSIEHILKLMDGFNKRTDQVSQVSNLDQMDLLTVLSERGSVMMNGFSFGEEHVKKPGALSKKIKESWKSSYLAETSFSHVSKVAMIVDVPENITKILQVEDVFSEMGAPLELFTGVFEAKEACMYVMITGLPYPTDMLKAVEDDITKEEAKIVESLDKVRSQQFAVKQRWTDSLKRKRKIKM